MLAGEQSTALLYGLQLDKGEKVYQGFGHQVVSLSWGGKRDYATWFSPSPAAMLAILLLPASPSSAAYLAGDPDRIRAQVAEATAGAGYAQQFGDYLLMYAGLAGEEDRETALDGGLEPGREVGRRRQQPVVPARVAHGPSVSVGA